MIQSKTPADAAEHTVSKPGHEHPAVAFRDTGPAQAAETLRHDGDQPVGLPLSASPATTGLKEARRRFAVGDALPDNALHPLLQASWQRSRQFGLEPQGRASGVPHASAVQLARLLEQRRELVAHARPVMEYLSEQIRGTDSIVMLGDPCGMVLCSLGDDSFAERAARVALRPGANWHEQWRGTNAIGTVIACGRSVVVQGQEHYLERNGFLSCAAAPILDSRGRLLGVLDISGHRGRLHQHTLSLVRAAARQVEHRLFETQHGGDIQLRLHTSPEGIGTLTEGLLALSEDGLLIGADESALVLLGLSSHEIGAVHVEDVLGVPLQTLAAARHASHLSFQPPRRPDGVTVHGSPRWGRERQPQPAAAQPPTLLRSAPQDALASLDLGDTALQTAITRARKVLGKPIPLLLLGESGVGKEVFARACHDSSPRARRPFVAVNCAALPEHLIESELFGYRSGAFTGASRLGGTGRIREADGGTLFLDEIGDMPRSLQTHLLRVLQERQVVPLGGGPAVPVDFQLMCATNRVLHEEVAAGRFREDLFYRINGLTVQLPALRERSDLPALVRLILQAMSPEQPLQLQPEVLARFRRYRWPGNLRQLANVLQTAVALLEDNETVIGFAHLPDELAPDSGPRHAAALEDPQADLRLNAERCLQHALDASGGNLSDAARRLGISRSTLYRKLQAAGLPVPG